MTLTIGQSASKHIIEAFGWEVNEDGVIVASNGDWIPSYCGEKAHLDEEYHAIRMEIEEKLDQLENLE